MFEIILQKYKRKMKKGIPGKVRIQIILFSVSMIVLLFGCFLNGLCICGVAILCVFGILLWIHIGKKLDKKRTEKNSFVETFTKRNSDFETFLKENGMEGLDNVKLLEEKCREKLNEQGRPKEYLMPAFLLVIIPMIMMFLKVLIEKLTIKESIVYVIIITIFLAIWYFSIKILDEEICEIKDKDYYYIKKMKDDLEVYAFFMRKDKLRNTILGIEKEKEKL